MNHSITLRIGAALLGLAAAGAAAGGANTEGLGPAPATADLARRADWVVRGRVAAIETSTDSAGRVGTRVELEAVEFMKGPATNPFALRLAGGVLGRRKVTYSGQPEYALGEDVVVFAVRNPAGEPVTLDMAWGKFEVRTGTNGPVVVPPSGAGKAASLSELKRLVTTP
jgi:hypothetical protein